MDVVRSPLKPPLSGPYTKDLPSWCSPSEVYTNGKPCIIAKNPSSWYGASCCSNIPDESATLFIFSVVKLIFEGWKMKYPSTEFSNVLIVAKSQHNCTLLIHITFGPLTPKHDCQTLLFISVLTPSVPSQTKFLTGGGDLRKAQVDVPLSVSHTCVWSHSWAL